MPAFAQSNCAAPIPPAAPDGRTATQQQMVAAVNDAKNFIAQSDVYQQCLLDYVQAQKDQAANSKKKFDASIAADANKKIAQNQAEKQQTGNAINAAVNLYKTTHSK
jgi:hypothetical protein